MPENFDLTSEIENSSETKESIREETLDAINTAKNILNHLKESNPEKYKIALIEYEDLRLKTIGFVKSDNEITEDELSNIKLELSQIKKISNDNKERSIFDKLSKKATAM